MIGSKVKVKMQSDSTQDDEREILNQEDEMLDENLGVEPGSEPSSSEQDEVQQLREELQKARLLQMHAEDHAQRRLADYHNLVRRTQEDRAKLIKLASKELMSDILEPLSHLSMAAAQLNDQGLTMTVKQLWQKLSQNGLKELEVLGKPFDVTTMEAVDVESDDNAVVTKVVTPGYELNGEVIAHAKVVLGKKSN